MALKLKTILFIVTWYMQSASKVNFDINTPKALIGIVMAVYERPSDHGIFPDYRSSLWGIRNQTYSHWKLFIIGDALSSSQEMALINQIKSAISNPNQVIYRNLESSVSERHIYDKKKSSLQCSGHDNQGFYCWAGKNATNLALDIADKDPNVTHIAFADGDYCWDKHHLQNAMLGFNEKENKDVGITVSSRSNTIRKSRSIPCDNKFLFSIVIQKSIMNLRFRGYDEQNYPRPLKPDHKRCVSVYENGSLSMNADMLYRMHEVIALDQVTAALVPGGEHTNTRTRRHASESLAHFGIIVMTYERPRDPLFRLIFNTSLLGIKHQTYANWTLFLIGDGLNIRQETALLQQVQKSIPDHKVVFRNLDSRLSERNVHKNSGEKIAYYTGGINAGKLANSLAIADSRITHIAMANDDDAWSPDHLQNLADAFNFSPDVGFAFSRASGMHRSPNGFPWMIHDDIIYAYPIPCELVIATVSWKLSYFNTYMRDYEEQMKELPRKTSFGCLSPSTFGPGDAHLISVFYELIKRGKFKSALSPKVDVNYLTSKNRLHLIDKLYGNYSSKMVQ